MGKESKYIKANIAERLESIRGWAQHGVTKEGIAKQLGISRSTLSVWEKTYPEFAEALKTGKLQADGEILNAAFKQAIGYKTKVREPVKVKKQVYEPNTKRIITSEEVEIVEYEKYFPPVPLMTRFMLINRLPNDYKAVPEEQGSGETVITHYVPREAVDGKESPKS